MRLHSSPASPFGRKVKVVAHETGTFAQLEITTQPVSPVGANDTVNAVNPLGKIPCLVLADGSHLYDSAVICEYLASLASSGIFPAGEARWPVLCVHALADGLLDAALAVRYEMTLRPEAMRWPEWIAGQKAKIGRALDELDRLANGFGDRVEIGTITVGCALGYLDFRFADDPWRSGRPNLTAWYESFAKRPSMVATAPQ